MGTDNSCIADNVMFMSGNSSNTTMEEDGGASVVPPLQGGRHVVEVSDAGFSPASLSVNGGDMIEFIWVNGTNSVSAGSCASPSSEFHSGVFSPPYSFVHTALTSAAYYSRT